MWSSGIGKKIAVYDMYVAKLRDGSKMKFFSHQFRERVKMEREREWTYAKNWSWNVFFLFKDIHPFMLRDF
jgi:hypothetical protein